MNVHEKTRHLERRRRRVRKKVFGTSERPRLNVFRSRMHIYAQIIDDLRGHTLAATGKPGVCFVTRGPGATNASGGVHARLGLAHGAQINR